MRVYLAGTIDPRDVEIAQACGAGRYQLESIIKLTSRQRAAWWLGTASTPTDRIVDSGLFTFMFGSTKGGKAPDRTYEGYRRFTLEYLERLAAFGLDKCLVVEVDAQRLIGVDETHRLRELFAPLGKNVMYVWHQPEGIPGLRKLAREREYVGIGMPELRRISGAIGRTSNELRDDLLREIHEACADIGPPRVHLLGGTSVSSTSTSRAWSADSTSFLSGARYGAARVWDSSRSRIISVGKSSEAFRVALRVAREAFPEADRINSARTLGKTRGELVLVNAYTAAMQQRWLDRNFTAVKTRTEP